MTSFLGRRLPTLGRCAAACIVVALTLWVALLPGGATADTPVTRVYVNPASVVLPVTGTTTLEVRVDNVSDLYGADVQLAFDPTVLQVLDDNPKMVGVQVTPGPLLQAALVDDIEADADNNLGSVRFIRTLLNPMPAVSGSGVLLTFRIEALAPGHSPLDFAISDLVGLSGSDIFLISHSTTGGSVTVVPIAPATVSLSANPGALQVGASTVLTATVANNLGNPVADGTAVTFTCTNGRFANGSTTYGATTVSGVAQAVFTATTQGTATIAASAGDASDSLQLAISAANPPRYTVRLPIVARSSH